jgi:nicotinate-nucleotide adenylyltransferase
MNVCLFGGTFDPIHNGHIAVARAASDRFGLKRVLFCPAYVSPFKQEMQSAAYPHRFAMVALATADHKTFMVSDLESPEMTGSDGPNYTVDTVRRLKAQLGRSDKLYFLCGEDAFQGISKWRDAENLLRQCEFIVASRPGHRISQIAAVLPERLRPSKAVLQASKNVESDALVLPGATLHLLRETAEKSSATGVRAAVSAKKSTKRDLPESVAEYVKKHGLYKSGR